MYSFTNEELAVRIKDGESSLISTLWEQVKRFAQLQASKFYNKHYNKCKVWGVELDDLEQEAFLGILDAVQGFEAEKGFKFLTYATYHLRKRFYSSLKLDRAEGKRPNPISLDKTLYTDDNGNNVTLLHTLADQRAEIDKLIDRIYIRDISKSLKEALNELPIRQRQVAINCFCRGLSYSEYGRNCGVTSISVRQAWQRALRRLKKNPKIVICAY